MLQVLLLSVLGPAALGLLEFPEPQLQGSQCVEQDCYGLFRGPATFRFASQACQGLRGHLMTVRSSVAADVISLLLSGDSSRLWIGLKLPPGCRDSGQLGPLRGFQWVTGDNNTSYNRWARLPQPSLCGPLCVAVSAARSASGEQVWEEELCTVEADGFLCEFHFTASCRPLTVEPGATAATSVSITYRTPFGGRGADFQALPEGSSAVVAPFGVELVCEKRPGEAEARWGREEPGAWDCGVENGGCQHACNQSAGASLCLCPADTAPQADLRSCAAPEEHSCDKLCEHFCVRNPDVPGSYSCMCATGYKLAANQHGCEDVDDCMQVPSPCQQLCVNKQGGFECHCHRGYDMVNGECVESVDPCVGSNCEYQCQPLGKTDYRCVCAEGFVPNPQAPHKCQMFCNQTSCSADCDPNNPDTCQCPEGYILDEGFLCTDIDECDNGNCLGADSCRNLPGSYECICGSDSAQAGTDCDLTTVSNGVVEGGSGEAPVSPTPGATSSSSPAGSVHSGVLIGVSILSLCLVVELLALLCHLRKKQDAIQAKLEYKCEVPAKEVVLQHVRTEQTPQIL
ncbi:thrombomodulin [Pteronotus mesoamericanus]|uniref:thrombomodulin n=1 Tax=Pteronotus mesoamericanus TaxID=1884717 RepID=UPI0023EDE334|nr:thrombomodulin [Pteronotus parnellii mesoamericanus]